MLGILWRTGYLVSGTSIVAEADIFTSPAAPGYSGGVTVENALSPSFTSVINGATLMSEPCYGGAANGGFGVTGTAEMYGGGTTYLCGNSGYQWAKPQISPSTYTIAGISWANSTAISTFMNDSLFGVIGNCDSGGCTSNELDNFPAQFTPSVYPAFGFGEDGGGNGYAIFQWVRGRALPPNSIMPTVQYNK